MLILVGVTVTVAINGGLFGKAREGAKGTEIARQKEELEIAVASAYDVATGIIKKNELKKALGEGWNVEGEEGGPYNCTIGDNEFIVYGDGKIAKTEELVSYKTWKDGENTYLLIFLENQTYCEKLFIQWWKGECLYNEIESEATTVDDIIIEFAKYYIDDEKIYDIETALNDILEVGSSIGLFNTKEEFINYCVVSGSNFIKMNGEYWGADDGYPIELESGKNTIEILIDDKIQIIEIMNITLGSYVKYDADQDGSVEDEILYRVLYREGELGENQGAQIISNDVLAKNSVYLGYDDDTIPEETITDIDGDGNLKLEKAIYSYNNSVETLNNKCAELPEAKQVTGITKRVRSVGSDPINEESSTEMFYKTSIPNYGESTWFDKYDGLIRAETQKFDYDQLYDARIGKLP